MQKRSGNFSGILILPCEVKFCIPCVPDLSILRLLFAHLLGLQPLPGEASSPWFAGGGCQPPCPCIPPCHGWLLESHWNQYATPHLFSLDACRGFQSPALCVKPGTDFFFCFPPSPSMVLIELPTTPRLGWKLCFPFL